MQGHTLFHLTLTFFIVMDPLGNLPIFVSLLKHFDPERQRKIIIRELLISLGIMILAIFFGNAFFELLHISTPSLEIAGGIILFIIAMQMILSITSKDKPGRISKDPFIVPLAVPAVAGPGILATITLYGAIDGKTKVFFAILIAWVILFPILLFSPQLKRLLGDNGIIATERLFGYLVVLIAINMTLHGLSTVIGLA